MSGWWPQCCASQAVADAELVVASAEPSGASLTDAGKTMPAEDLDDDVLQNPSKRMSRSKDSASTLSTEEGGASSEDCGVSRVSTSSGLQAEDEEPAAQPKSALRSSQPALEGAIRHASFADDDAKEGGCGGEVLRTASTASDMPARCSSAASHASQHAAGDMVRVASKNIFRRMSRKHTTLRTASKRVPAPAIPSNAKPLYSGRLSHTPLAKVRSAIMTTEKCPMLRFLREVLSCHSISSTEWLPCADMPGTLIRKAHWLAPLPADVPSTIAKMLRIPSTVSGTSVWRLKEDNGELLLVQHSYTKDVLYGERFKMQSTLAFKEEEEGVLIRNYADTIWVSPLPWTHAAVKHFVERKVRVDTASTAGDLMRVLEEAAQQA